MPIGKKKIRSLFYICLSTASRASRIYYGSGKAYTRHLISRLGWSRGYER
jgi:hypothetical protein